MQSTQVIRVIGADVRKVMQEPLFWFIMLAPFLVGWIMRYALPGLNDRFESFQLADYYGLVLALLILTPPLYYGIVLALLVLEEKDENVLLAVAVTPLKLKTYLAARILVYTVISLPLIMLVHELIGVVEIEIGKLFWVAVAASLNAPLLVLLLAAFCKNQLEGFVIGKAMSPLILFPLAMYFVPDYWHVFCGVLPTYWPIIAYFTAISETGSDQFFGFAIVMAIITQSLVLTWLYRRFERGLTAA